MAFAIVHLLDHVQRALVRDVQVHDEAEVAHRLPPLRAEISPAVERSLGPPQLIALTIDLCTHDHTTPITCIAKRVAVDYGTIGDGDAEEFTILR